MPISHSYDEDQMLTSNFYMIYTDVYMFCVATF